MWKGLVMFQKMVAGRFLLWLLMCSCVLYLGCRGNSIDADLHVRVSNSTEQPVALAAKITLDCFDASHHKVVTLGPKDFDFADSFSGHAVTEVSLPLEFALQENDLNKIATVSGTCQLKVTLNQTDFLSSSFTLSESA
jgi:hypothetical protein